MHIDIGYGVVPLMKKKNSCGFKIVISYIINSLSVKFEYF